MSQGGLNRTVKTFSARQYLLVNELVAAVSSAAVGGVVCFPPRSHMLVAPSWMPSLIDGAGVAADADRVTVPKEPAVVMATTASNAHRRRAEPLMPSIERRQPIVLSPCSALSPPGAMNACR